MVRRCLWQAVFAVIVGEVTAEQVAKARNGQASFKGVSVFWNLNEKEKKQDSYPPHPGSKMIWFVEPHICCLSLDGVRTNGECKKRQWSVCAMYSTVHVLSAKLSITWNGQCGTFLFCLIELCCVMLRFPDDGGANGEGNEGSSRVPRAEQKDVSARPPLTGVHDQGT